jgi:hypothetical protein
MAFKKEIGGEKFEIEPIAPYTEEEVENLIDDGKTVNEHYPRQVIRRKDDDEVVAEFKMVTDG